MQKNVFDKNFTTKNVFETNFGILVKNGLYLVSKDNLRFLLLSIFERGSLIKDLSFYLPRPPLAELQSNFAGRKKDMSYE